MQIQWCNLVDGLQLIWTPVAQQSAMRIVVLEVAGSNLGEGTFFVNQWIDKKICLTLGSNSQLVTHST